MVDEVEGFAKDSHQSKFDVEFETEASTAMTHVVTPEKLKPSKSSYMPVKLTHQQNNPKKLKSPIKGILAKKKKVTILKEKGDPKRSGI